MPKQLSHKKNIGIFQSIDWLTIFIYVILMALGWISVCGATYDLEQDGNFLDFSTRSGMQIVWMITSVVLAILILCTDDRLIESLSYLRSSARSAKEKARLFLPSGIPVPR